MSPELVKIATPLPNSHCPTPRRYSAFFQDMRARGLGDPLLVVSDGAPGVIKAIEACFPRAARQRCLAHRMRNLAAKVPEDQWPEFKARVQAAYQAPSRAIARDLAAGSWPTTAGPSVGGRLLRGRLRGLHRPPAHARDPSPSDQDYEPPRAALPRGAPALKIIPNAFGERPVLKLMFGAMIRAADRWRAIKFTDSSAARSPPSDGPRQGVSGSDQCPDTPFGTAEPVPHYPAVLGLDRHALWPRASLAARDGAAHGGSPAAAQKRRVTSTGSFLGSASGLGVAVSSAMPQIGHEPDPSATFSGDAWFGSAASAGMRGSAAPDSAAMRGSTAPRSAGMRRFSSATVSGDAVFNGATFGGDAWFDGARFSGYAWFDSATLSGDAWFDSATFSGDAWFGNATFDRFANFTGATFEKDCVVFRLSVWPNDQLPRSAVSEHLSAVLRRDPPSEHHLHRQGSVLACHEQRRA